MTESGGGTEPVGGARSPVRWSRIIGFAVGVALLGGAVLAIQRSGGSLADAFAPLREGDPLRVSVLAAALIGTIMLSSFVTAALLWVLTLRYGRVGYFEMWALISAAWLLNYLPVRPGMFGRLAYHRAVNGIRIVDSAKALVWTNVLMLIGAVMCAAVAIAASIAKRPDHPLFIVLSLTPIPLLGLFAAYAHEKKPEPDPEVWRVIAGLALGYAAQLCWAGRFLVSFHLAGIDLSWAGAVALASVSALAAFVPITGNGLGVREWVIGLVAPVLPIGLVHAANLSREGSFVSVLIDRSAELVVAVPMGLICGWWALRNMARVRGVRRQAEA